MIGPDDVEPVLRSDPRIERDRARPEIGFAVSRLERDDGHSIAVYAWPAPTGKPKAVVQIAHGMAEHAARYDRPALALTRAGYQVYASDHLGHGRTAQRLSDYGYFGPSDGWTRLVDDVHAVNRRIAVEHPNLPRVLMGHSFGSFIAQQYLLRYADTLNAAVLSGTTSGALPGVWAGRAVAALEKLRVGGRNRSGLLTQFSTGQYNQQFAPTRTPNDWLSRDPVEVDKYTGDPLCGFELTVQGWIDLLGGLIAIDDHAARTRIPRDLPVYLFAGSKDPVGRNGAGPALLAAAYDRAGMQRVSCKLYTEARHETLNETNRDEVVAELIAWLDANAARGAADPA
jgi:alpha-beta hydrolase superfamily lysophospholipase